MNPNQISLLKNFYIQEATKPDGKRSTLGEYMRFCLDGGIDFVTSKDCVIFDDDNTLLHCVCINNDLKSQANFPIKIMSASYDIVQQVETIMSQANFERFLNEAGLPISEDKKKFMLDWSHNIYNQALQPMDADPYYTQNPRIIPMPNTIIKRDDGIEHAEPPATLSGDHTISVKIISSASTLVESIANAKYGDVLFVDRSISITEPLTIDNAVYLTSNGATISAPVIVNADAVISGFKISVDDPNAGDGRGKALVKANCDNFTLTNCEFTACSKSYNIVNIACAGEVVIEGNTFISTDKSNVHNAIEFSQNTSKKVTDVTIQDNLFKKGCCGNNGISLFQFEDNAIVNIKNNHFELSANAVRLSNYSSSKNIKINCINNVYDEIDSTVPAYIGFLLLQAVDSYNDDFSGITILFKDLIGPGGKHILENGTGLDQVWYTYNTTTEPEVIFS